MEHERLSRTGPRSWMPVRGGVFVRVESGPVTGGEITGAHHAMSRPRCGVRGRARRAAALGAVAGPDQDLRAAALP
ncbi:hypothetical protein AMK33_34935 [Streptomyces sp. CB02400]|nr:hypothetical protein AMK33_34935 [Streptomyces sp. CB02400]